MLKLQYYLRIRFLLLILLSILVESFQGGNLIHLGKNNKSSVSLSQKNNCLTLGIELPDQTMVFSFDKNGRLWTALINKISYRRGLDGKIVAKWNSGKEVLHRKWLSEDEADSLLTIAHGKIRELIEEIDNGVVELNPPLDEPTIKELSTLALNNQHFYNRDVSHYASVYKPVGILPPDQYISVVLQLTEGCSFNKCTFCSFYKDRRFRIKNLEKFESHILDVKNFIGEGMSLRRTIFLGDANALVVPTKKLLPALKITHNYLDVEKLGGFYAFLDGFSGEKKSIAEFKQLKNLGMEKIYIGMESGNAALLKFLNKPGSPSDVLNAVRSIKSADISVGIIVLLGAGGKQYQEGHVNDTIEIINKMQLDADDLVYFSELIESEGLEYSNKAFTSNLKPLSSGERIKQRDLIEENLFFYENSTPHISTYDIRDFVY